MNHPSANSIAVVIVSYNGGDDLKTCVQLALEHDLVHAVWVVDNASTDDSLAKLTPDDRLRLLPQTRNLGFGRGNNLAMSAALKEPITHILWLNQDCYLEPHTINNLLRHSTSQADCGAVAPLELTYKARELTRGSLNWCYDHVPGYLCRLVAGTSNAACHRVKLLKGACVLLTRTAVEQVGGFDPIFFMYGEDDYSSRLRYHNYWTYFCTDTFVRHDEGKLQRYRSYRLRYRLYFGKLINNLKRPSHGVVRSIAANMRFVVEEICYGVLWFDTRRLTAAVAFATTCLNLRTVIHNRKLSLQGGGPWL